MKITRLTIREYAESLAIAFILAMIIRHFVAEAFRIPTSSMEPTLIGSEVGGDRILVSKFQFDLHPPKQWDVVVFKIDQQRIDFYRDFYSNRPVPDDIRPAENGTIDCPERANYVNYVKRLVALPGQTVLVKNGDIFIDGRIARKPERVEEVLLVPVTNDRILKRDGVDFFRQWGSRGGVVTRRDGALLFGAGHSDAECTVFYLDPIEDRVETDPEGMRRRGHRFNIVGDLKLAFRFRHLGGVGYLVGHLREDETRYSFYVDLGGVAPSARLLCNGNEVARAALSLAPGAEHRLEFANIDARVTLRINGRTLIRFDDDRPEQSEAASVPYRNPYTATSGAEFGAARCDVEVRDVQLWRDIFYTSDRDQQRFAIGEPFTLGQDEYFVMGDNSANSFDSRSWGVVKQPNLIGEAFFVFWPIPRWKFIN